MIAFIFAHLDDESYGPLGTIAKLSKDNEVFVLALCNGSRPGATVSNSRKNAFAQICNNLNIQYEILDNDDCTLEIAKVTSEISKFIAKFKPSTIYTHSVNDIHRDHRMVAEACIVASRPKPDSSVNTVYSCEIPAASEWGFGQYGQFSPNVYEDISEYIQIKKDLLSLYSTETYDYPDARSVQHTVDLARIRGSQVGFDYAESFQLVFSRNHKTH